VEVHAGVVERDGERLEELVGEVGDHAEAEPAGLGMSSMRPALATPFTSRPTALPRLIRSGLIG
jgi:hypothetical protein